MKKGQSTLELLLLTGFMFIVFLVVLSVGGRELISLQEEARQSQLVETAEFLENEILVAIEAEEGYMREFELPSTLAGENYVIELAEGENFTEVILKFGNEDRYFEKTLVVSPDVAGVINLGTEGMTTITVTKNLEGINVQGDVLIPECDDGIDNDGDGAIYIDLADPGCTGTADPSELGTVQCDDGIDNDYDGDRDMDDSNCGSPAENNETFCGDGTCEYGEHANNCAPDCGTATECNDGIDNDGDTYVDYHSVAESDPECSSRTDNDETS